MHDILLSVGFFKTAYLHTGVVLLCNGKTDNTAGICWYVMRCVFDSIKQHCQHALQTLQVLRAEVRQMRWATKSLCMMQQQSYAKQCLSYSIDRQLFCPTAGQANRA